MECQRFFLDLTDLSSWPTALVRKLLYCSSFTNTSTHNVIVTIKRIKMSLNLLLHHNEPLIKAYTVNMLLLTHWRHRKFEFETNIWQHYKLCCSFSLFFLWFMQCLIRNSSRNRLRFWDSRPISFCSLFQERSGWDLRWTYQLPNCERKKLPSNTVGVVTDFGITISF